MKKIFYLIFLFNLIAFSQVPQGISHRGTVYNPTNGVIVPNSEVDIRITILDGSTEIYKEIFKNVETNAQGQYSINIGTGLNPSSLFSIINWAGANKSLKVEIDLDNNSTISSPGSAFELHGANQLMSVPYALYAQNTNPNNSLRVLNNINELKNVVGNFGDLIYIKGHTTQGDGGGGNFIWRNESSLLSSTSPSSVFSQDNNGTIIQAVIGGIPNDTGRWVRQFDGFIDVRFFGVNFQGSTQKLQKAIDFASYNANESNPPTRGTTIFIPSGTYIIDRIILKNGITIIGDSMDATKLYSTIAGDNEYSSNPYLFEMAPGPVQIHISRLNIVGRGTIKGCFNFNAQLDGNYSFGGLYSSSFKDLKIIGFNGNGINLIGSSGVLLNQLTTFENVGVKRINDNSNSLNIEGLAGQLTFINCGFGGSNNNGAAPFSHGTNVKIKHLGDNYSSVISFINSTFSDSDFGIQIDFAENITLDNCWFENTGVGIDINGQYKSCKSININNSRFSNAAGFGSLSAPSNFNNFGRCINIYNSFVSAVNNHIHVSDSNSTNVLDDYFVLANDYTNTGVNLQNNTFSASILNKTSGIISVLQNVTNNKIDCQKNKVIFVNSSATSTPSPVLIKNIESQLNTGESIFIRANGGNITFNNLGNLYLTNKSTLTLGNGEAAVFIRIDNVYQLASIIRVSTP